MGRHAVHWPVDCQTHAVSKSRIVTTAPPTRLLPAAANELAPYSRWQVPLTSKHTISTHGRPYCR